MQGLTSAVGVGVGVRGVTGKAGCTSLPTEHSSQGTGVAPGGTMRAAAWQAGRSEARVADALSGLQEL